jgi:hypothetical protein
MRLRYWSAILAAVALAALPAVSQAPKAAAKVAKKWTPPHTPDGQPDIQGIWSNATITPLERPPEFAGKEFLTAKEADQYKKDLIERGNKDRRDGPVAEDVGRAYNDFWWDRGTQLVKTLRTSLVVDPPDGHVPPQTPEAQKRAAARAEARRLHPADGPEDRPLSERCIMLNAAGPPMLPSAYNNNYQIVQGPGFVSILNEMIHDVRVIPLDGRPHLPANIHQLKGDSRGHWEGNTLVVDTTNFTDLTAFRGSSEKLHLVERFTRTEPDTLLYEFTVSDPSTWEKSWSVSLPSVRVEGPIYEYACHEGNYGMTGLLQGARSDEQKTAAKVSK